MKKLIALLTVFGFLTFGIANNAFAQKEQKSDNAAQTEQVADSTQAAPETAQAEKFRLSRKLQVIRFPF